MLQSFEIQGAPQKTAARVAALRTHLQAHRLDGFIVSSSDEHMNEYVPDCARRLLWLTGFSGSAGQAFILADKAAVFVDGRYTLQAHDQVNAQVFETLSLTSPPPADWLAKNLNKGQRFGYDPKLHTAREAGALEKACAKAGAELVMVDINPVDAVWDDRPPTPLAPLMVHANKFAGQESAGKRARIAAKLKAKDIAAAVLTLPDSIAWLLNIRGNDVAHNPVALCFAIVHDSGTADLFVDGSKLSDAVRAHLSNEVCLHEPAALEGELKALGQAGKTVLVDPRSAAKWFEIVLTGAGAKIAAEADPCLHPKAIKNKIEIEGARQAHIRDGIALCRFLAWFDAEAATGKLDEMMLVRQLEEFRRDSDALHDISFDTIAGAGEHGAIVHYRVTHESNRVLGRHEMFLLDSGGQYRDGTTDVTRTLIAGTPTDEMRTRYTLVLRGHIALAAARFPKGTAGSGLDVLARRALWQAGLDYEHGTGHGVGSFLNVHEGPQGISRLNHVALEPGMILSNEPGYYKEGAYGIRLENLMVVRTAQAIEGGETDMLGFETLTMAPFDKQLIVVGMLGGDEQTWLNGYHAMVFEKISGSLKGSDKTWLAAACKPL